MITSFLGKRLQYSEQKQAASPSNNIEHKKVTPIFIIESIPKNEFSTS
jgi:hypothetical protein